ncbi:hypothetical protein OpiT1DRAFT_05397 [Opitutaceae bacterium TAV1]|nr:hypothetical protein OpiT1DRAFT_05397 [Opitutaceae bacterium TAV1]
MKNLLSFLPFVLVASLPAQTVEVQPSAPAAPAEGVAPVAAPAVAAVPEIDGAFGLKLGDTFDVAKGKPVAGESSANTYSVVPPVASGLFQLYLVSVTPVTKTIYQIRGVADVGNPAEDKETFEFLYRFLIGKYGSSGSLAVVRSDNSFSLKRGTRKISVSNIGTLWVVYSDSALEEKDQQERDKLTARKMDMSGL